MRQIDSKERWLISGSYVAMLIPCLIFFGVAERLFHQPLAFSLGIPIVGYLLIVISMTNGYQRYYGGSSNGTATSPMQFQGAVKMLWPFITAAAGLAIPALSFNVLALHYIQKGERFVSAACLLVGVFFSVLYLIRVRQVSSFKI